MNYEWKPVGSFIDTGDELIGIVVPGERGGEKMLIAAHNRAVVGLQKSLQEVVFQRDRARIKLAAVLAECERVGGQAMKEARRVMEEEYHGEVGTHEGG